MHLFHPQHAGSHTGEVLRRGLSNEAIEIIMGILLATSGAMTSWCGYQSALWDGIQASKYTQAGAVRSESVRASMKADQQIVVDVQLYTAWLEAYATGDTRRADFYRARFRPEFKPAFEAWVESTPLKNPKALPTPFDQPQYRIAMKDTAELRAAEADQKFKDGQNANAIGDNYVKVTVTFAMAMFFIGVAQQFKTRPVRAALMVLSAAMVLIGMWYMWEYPIAHAG